MTPDVCPVCGAEVPPKAKVCPECGADEDTGWAEGASAHGLGLPEENFDYEDFVKREFGGGKKNPVPRGMHWFWWVVGILVLITILWTWLR